MALGSGAILPLESAIDAGLDQTRRTGSLKGQTRVSFSVCCPVSVCIRLSTRVESSVAAEGLSLIGEHFSTGGIRVSRAWAYGHSRHQLEVCCSAT